MNALGSGAPISERFWRHVDRTGTCWVWTAGHDKDGYGTFKVSRSRPKDRAHRVMWELTNGAIPEGLFVCHHCDNPPCVRPDHLWLGTTAENTADMIRKGRQHKGRPPAYLGESNVKARLTAEQVLELRRIYAAGGVTQKRLAQLFGVDQTTISRITLRKGWVHI